MHPRIDEVAGLWQRFWFTPQSPLPLSLMRWFIGGMLLYTHLIWSFDLTAFFADERSWQPGFLIDALQVDQSPISFWWYVSADWVWLAHGLALVILALFWIGFATPITSWLTFFIVISYANRAPLAMYGLDQINALSALYLAVSDSGARLSADARIRRWFASRRQRPTAQGAAPVGWTGGEIGITRRMRLLAWVPFWRRSPDVASQPTIANGVATRLFQVHLCFIYLWSGLGKLQGETWWDGEAMWLIAASLDYQSNDLTWIAWFPWLYQAITVGTWVWEVFFPVLVWHPRLRGGMLAIGLLMHLGIGLFMGMWTFGLAMIFLYGAFVPPPVLQRIGQRLRKGWIQLAMNEQHPEAKRRQQQTALGIGVAATAALLLLVSLLRPDDQNSQVQLALAQQQLDRDTPDRAIESFDRVLQRVPDHVVALHGRGLAYDRLGETELALADYTAAIELDPNYFEAINDRGILLLRSGKWEDGVADFRTLVGMEPMNLASRVNYAFAMQKAGRSQEAAACLEVIPDDQRDSTVHYLLGCLAQQQMDWARAEQLFSSAIELDSGNLKAWLNRALCRYQLGQRDAAAADLQQVADLDDEWMLQGTIETLRERFEPTGHTNGAERTARSH